MCYLKKTLITCMHGDEFLIGLLHFLDKMIKGYKVTDIDRNIKIGIGAESLKDLISKIKKKFSDKENKINKYHLYACDGTLISSEDYFQTIPPHTLLIWTSKKDFKTEADILYDIVTNANSEFLTSGKKSSEFFSEKLKRKIANLAEILKQTDDKSHLSYKHEDIQWFDGIETKYKTKEKFLFSKSQDRIRTYFYKTREELRKLAKTCLKRNQQFEHLEQFLRELQTKLKDYCYFGCFFDRTFQDKDTRSRSICDSNGVFMCEGLWNKEGCLYVPVHMINPYMNREQRLLFQMWNLDHQIERSRTIIPAVLSVIEKNFDIDAESVFDDLFTLNNLKLVHIICHDKGSHSIPNESDKPRYQL